MQNTLAFGPNAQKEFRETGVGFGMLGVTGKLRATEKKDQRILKKKS